MAEKRKYLPLASTKHLEKMMTRHYALSRYHRLWGKPLKRPLAWITSGAPVELLRAFNIHPVYPENYGAICGTRRVSAKLCQVAEAAGYSQDLCSYARTHIGSILRPDLAPMGGLPKPPDLLVCCNNICGTVLKWYEALARIFQVPLLVLDTPYLPARLTDHTKEYVLAQFEQMVVDLERLTGRRLNRRELAEQLARSSQAIALWKEIREFCKTSPSPLNAPDLFIHMAPIVTLRGTQQAVDYYRRLKEEVNRRVRQRQGAVDGEKIRLVWDNIAIWYRIFGFFKMFSERGACFVTDTYSGGWVMELPSGDPLESMAITYTEIFLNRSPDFRAEQMINLIKEYNADGFVMHSNRSCKPYSLIQEVIRRRVTRETGVPGLVVEADMADERVYAEEPIRNRVQAFLETVGGI
ncbi:2-hydroxyacyl-CoA dehydratase subunit D [Desulfoscipio geothermicus]|uniref:Benzoyl-CoA reductase/2-hydroxyglutaryl-CoA dehydratase subunit, BcrC/BadD/HgdB n=1 Tax=Desulfoscipio geothermicus DSM 3669 TaxID=1121426 RepID=A0A1I6D635_9FIRM|nr:2-hydroxyacyl-CoA dehydratase family protein [Desulfoscipio geothermicus]SFR00916.1 Benzoyl-CoA reductase/2-hydroxyglutaryl-CoA dehydratase subunit, BcrC/BadD/HgdB [Desulfoscipio geothermicus DSM 3669]